ncbi:MAG: CHASE domain-containing protein, partial [Deltaproteobacteria bacterium]|nr:CHASE domain-containing protein [Deltaproteobacteria bacterium]
IAIHLKSDLIAHAIVLKGLVGLFNASPRLTREGFRHYFEAIRIGSCILDSSSLAYHEYIPASQLAQHVNKMRREGFADYRISPDGVRDVYTPLIYIEPFTDQNRKVLGFDPYTVAAERTAIERARDSGLVVISSKVILAQDSGTSRPGFVMYAPIYHHGLTYATQEERRKMFVGWVDSPLRMESLVLNLPPEKLQGINLEVF